MPGWDYYQGTGYSSEHEYLPKDQGVQAGQAA